jgi:hypothetical protein
MAILILTDFSHIKKNLIYLFFLIKIYYAIKLKLSSSISTSSYVTESFMV